MTGTRRHQRMIAPALAALLLAAVGIYFLLSSGKQATPTRTCAYSSGKLSTLRTFEHLADTRFRCVVLFDTAAPNWTAWERPWFIGNPITDEDWSSFGRIPGNQLIITVNLFPSTYADTNWRAIGAAGGYTAYAKNLGENLVRAGFGRAVIRLGHEANGTWFADNVGTTPAEWSEWKTFWQKTVTAMRSVPGAHFSFDWCIAAGYRAIPFSAYYPGDAYVDSIGVDIYDNGLPKAGVPSGLNRWTYQYDRPGGIGAIVKFAQAHDKPLSIPEWGLETTNDGGAGDDPTFTAGIAALIHSAHVSYDAYFFGEGSETAILSAPKSLAIYKRSIVTR